MAYGNVIKGKQCIHIVQAACLRVFELCSNAMEVIKYLERNKPKKGGKMKTKKVKSIADAVTIIKTLCPANINKCTYELTQHTHLYH